MIRITIEVEVNDVLVKYEKQLSTIGVGYNLQDIEKAQSLLLQGYQKIHKGLESQK